jgi:hypothetical protein
MPGGCNHRGDTVIVKGTRVELIADPVFRHERDAAYWIVRSRVLEGEYGGSEGWLVASSSAGPWDVAGGVFL